MKSKFIIFVLFLLTIFIPVCKANMGDDIKEMRGNSTRLIDDTGVIIDGEIPSEYSFALGKNNSAAEISNYAELPEELRNKISSLNSDTSRYIVANAESSQALDSIKGKYSVLYKNVDIFDNQLIDVKMTIIDFDASGISIDGRIDSVEDAAFMFRKENMGIYSSGIRWVTVKYEFFKSGTNEPIYVKGNTTYWDIDALQGVVIQDNNKGLYSVSCNDEIEGNECKLYISSKDNLKYIFSNTEYNDTSNNVIYSFSEIFEGYSITRTYQYMNPLSRNWYSNAGFIGNSSKLSSPASLQPIKKYSDKEVIKSDEYVTYSLNQYIPLVLPQYYYKSLVIEDELDKFYIVDVNNISIENEKGENTKDFFDVELKNHKLTLKAKNLENENIYGHTYIIKIKAKIDEKNISDSLIDNKYVISNKATTIYTDYNDEKDVLSSNEVNVTYEKSPKVIEAPNTGINNYILFISGIVMIFAGIYIFCKRDIFASK